ncbi:MAG: phosphoribosylglycinamide formyltransferase [Lachnospiraceae bacterium]|nr:phosphoribosylglycinamide formyltransferase [Lachnospiraceae bacterium]
MEIKNTGRDKKDIGIFSYDIRHRKTYDTLCLLKAKGYEKVTVYAQPLHYRKTFEPLLKHRPDIGIDIPDIEVTCRNFSYSFVKGRFGEIKIAKHDVILVCGAGIIPEDIVKRHIIVNAHPGYIPLVRGLDSFKWAIWEEKPIGVTVHVIGDYVDAGEVIDRKIMEINENTTFFEAAQNVYENEISMLVAAIEKINEKHIFMEPEDTIIHKRMPHEIEKKLMDKFEEYKKKVIIPR